MSKPNLVLLVLINELYVLKFEEMEGPFVLYLRSHHDS